MTSNKPIISIIAAIGEKRELGKDNKLLWNIPEDMKRFRRLTEGHAVIMGRKTYESIGRPLSNRINIVITRQADYQAPGCIVVASVEEALAAARAKEQEEIFIIGGGEIYKQALPYAGKLYLTVVRASAAADSYFPEYAEFGKIVSQKDSRNNEYQYTFIVIARNQ